jgi:NTP pyrophosphatase (non-canonical NTP hydrolase)
MIAQPLGGFGTMSSEIIASVLDLVAQANPTRSKPGLERRVTKLLEEIGEVSQAFLSVTSATNDKKKTWSHVCEEAADVLIIAVDIALTVLDDQQRLGHYVETKLHRINLGFHQIVWRVSQLNAMIGSTRDPATATQCSGEMVRYAFALNNLLDDPTKLCATVQRKIRKWKRKQ